MLILSYYSNKITTEKMSQNCIIKYNENKILKWLLKKYFILLVYNTTTCIKHIIVLLFVVKYLVKYYFNTIILLCYLQ